MVAHYFKKDSWENDGLGHFRLLPFLLTGEFVALVLRGFSCQKFKV